MGDVLHLYLVSFGLLRIDRLIEVERFGVAYQLTVLADQLEVNDAQTLAGTSDDMLDDPDNGELMFV
jgi:hypothetical protein